MEFEIKTERSGALCVVTIAGEVDVYTAPQLKTSLIEQIEDGCTDLLVDLRGVSFIDSSGLGVLIGVLRRTKEGSGTIRLVCSRGNVMKVFRITGLDKVFPIFESLEEARAL